MLKRLKNTLRRRRTAGGSRPNVEALEERALLAGDVAAAMRGESLRISGDEAANQVEIVVIDGDVVLRGIDGTTVNGSPDPFVVAPGTSRIEGSVYARLGSGADAFVIDGGVAVGDDVRVYTDGGRDAVSILDARVTNHVYIRGIGKNTILFSENANIGGDINVALHHDEDTIIVNGTVGDDVVIRGRRGRNAVTLDGARIGDDFIYVGDRSRDDVIVRNSVIGDDALIYTKSGRDFVMFENNTVTDKTRVRLGRDNDNLLTEGTNTTGRLRVTGDSGNDAIEISDGSTSGRRARMKRFERSTVSDRLVEERLNGVPNGVDTKAAAATNAVNALISDTALTVSLGSDLTEGAGEREGTVSIDSPRFTDLVIRLSSSDESELVLPETVTIPAGQTSALFTFTVQDDTEADGDQSVRVRADAFRILGSEFFFDVADNEQLELSLSVTEISEGDDSGAVIGTVSRSSEPTEDLVVNLFSSDGSAATVIGSVTIPAGQDSVMFAITPVDDDDDDGTQMVTITATATSHRSASTMLDVTDDEELHITIEDPTFVESAGIGAATARITRDGDTALPLTVSLSSSDIGEATVPLEVTIPAGQSFVDFTIDAVDDSQSELPQNVTITARADGLSDATANVTVLDDDILTVTLAKSEISEGDGEMATTGTVSRPTPTPVDLEISLGSDDTTAATVPETVTMLAGQSSVTFDIAAVDDDLDDGTQTASIAASADGHASDSALISVTDDEQLLLEITPGTFSEAAGNGAANGVVTRQGDTTNPLTVTLTSSNENEATVPQTVEIGAGEFSAAFTVDAVDEAVADLARSVTITASAEGHGDAVSDLTVTDDDALLTVSLDDDSISEADGSTTATVIRNSPVDNPLVVTVVSNIGGVNFPETVTIPADSDRTTFTISAVDDSLPQADRNITFTATADQHVDGTADLTVVDDDLGLTVTISKEFVGEASGDDAAVVTIATNSTSGQEISVTLESSDTSEVVVPTSVTIPAGQASVSVNLDAKDDNDADGVQSVTITATAANQLDGVASVGVTDDESIEMIPPTDAVESNETLVTKTSAFTIRGATEAGATINVDSDNDGQFDDGTLTADAEGVFTFSTTLVHNEANRGANSFGFQAETGNGDLEITQNVHLALGSVVRFDSVAGSYDVELLDADQPNTVANFRNYFARYTNSLIHRSPDNFVIQGGGFVLDGADVNSVVTDPAIQNEFKPGNSNVRGTLSMALLGGQPNSGTSGWFVNVGNNTFLDNAFHTVFGRVIGAGMDVVDAINNLPIFDVSRVTGRTAFRETPLRGTDPSVQLDGTVSIDSGNRRRVLGSGTTFTQDLSVDEIVSIGGSDFFVDQIVSDTELLLSASSSVLTDVPIHHRPLPGTLDDSNFVFFNSISEILDDM